MNNLSQEHKDRIYSFFQKNELEYLNVNEYLNDSDFNDIDFSDAFNQILDILEDHNAFNEIEIIYYDNAINYLKKYDPSLIASIEIAFTCGYELENLNSEILATLLAQENTKEQFYVLRDEIENFFSNFDQK